MSIRTVVNKLMLMGPVVFLSAVSISGHASTPSDDKAIFGDKIHQALLEYSKPLRDVEGLSQSGAPALSPELERVADNWISLAKSAKLATIAPVDFDIAPQDTVLGQIRQAKSSLVYALESRATMSYRNGDYDEASKWLARVVRVAGINKYSEFTSTHEYGLDQARCLHQLAAIAPRVSEETKRWSYALISDVKPSETELRTIAMHIRMLHTSSLSRKGLKATTIELAEGYGAIAEAVSTTSESATLQLRQISLKPQTSIELANVSTQARLAVKSEATYRQELAIALDALQSVK